MTIVEKSQAFIKLESLAAKLLSVAVVLALVLSNSSWHGYYEKFFNGYFYIHFNGSQYKTTLLQMINEGLMTIFFLMVGLEIKSELLEGALDSYSKVLLPVIAALGGMIVPAILFVSFNYNNAFNLRGWAIPTATDIAFALGVLSLLGSRVSTELKIFLTALAIIDDLVAIIIIALFYTVHISSLYLEWSLLCVWLLSLLNIKKINNIFFYVVVGAALWFCLLRAGVHSTLAGVILAFFVPLHHTKKYRMGPLYSLKRLIHPVVALAIIPIFAFANAGFPLSSVTFSTMHASLIWGTLVSLFLGKQIGVFFASFLAVKLHFARLPKYVSWMQLYGVATLCGIGFTISIFIGTLAFSHVSISYLSSVKIGIFAGSLLSGLVGYLLLRFAA